MRLVQHGHETLKAHAAQRLRVRVVGKILCRKRIGEHFPQAAAWQIGCAARQIQNLLAGGSGDATGSPGPETGECAKQSRPAGARLSENQDALAGMYFHLLILQYVAILGAGKLESLDAQDPGRTVLIFDAAFAGPRGLRGREGTAEARDADEDCA